MFFFVSMLSTFGSGGVNMFGSSHVQLTVCVWCKQNHPKSEEQETQVSDQKIV